MGSDSLNKSLPYKDRTRVFLHQLSQTLTSLRGILELALLVDSDEHEYRRAIQQSLEQAEGLVQLFKSYRAMAESETTDLGKERVGLVELVQVALEQLRPRADSRQLTVHLEWRDNCLLQTDPALLLEALRRGLLRAIQQSPTGGKLEVCVSSKEGSACLTISARAQKAEVYSPPQCDEIPARESQRELAPDSAEGDWTPVRRAVEALGGSVLVLSAEAPPLICKICLPLSPQEGW
jgi:light-regulated signal transduction histidine kinase (bacteriophytochrome)